mmetsp:Transcript_40976/g.85512  ORF Transcript_40976/g.85512 Transcript_40976/m.85512 type:complete len:140 (-) Transcript_40976:325-744(-)
MSGTWSPYRSITQITSIPKFPHLNSLILGASDIISDAIPPIAIIQVPATTAPKLESPINQADAEQVTARSTDTDGPAKRIQMCASVEGRNGSFTCAEQTAFGHNWTESFEPDFTFHAPDQISCGEYRLKRLVACYDSCD